MTNLQEGMKLFRKQLPTILHESVLNVIKGKPEYHQQENQLGESSSRSAERAPFTDRTNYYNSQIRGVQNQQSGKGWYAQLSDEKKKEYLQRQRVARQQRKDANRSGVHIVDVSQSSSHTNPLSTKTSTQNSGM